MRDREDGQKQRHDNKNQTMRQSSPTHPHPPTHPSKKKKDKSKNNIKTRYCLLVGWLVGGLTSQQQASVSQGRICSDNCTCCHTEIEAADQTFYLTQSQYTDTGPTSPSADPITPGAWQGSHWSAKKNPGASGIQTRYLPLSRRTP